MRGVLVALVLVACGTSPPRVESRATLPTEPAARAAPFAGHGPVTLRSSDTARAPFHAELGADGSITGTRCGATRFTDEGALERDGTVIARVVERGDVLAIVSASDHDTGWRIEDDVLVASGETRFRVADGTIHTSNAQLPTITVDPPGTAGRVVLGLFALLLVCDDLGP